MVQDIERARANLFKQCLDGMPITQVLGTAAEALGFPVLIFDVYDSVLSSSPLTLDAIEHDTYRRPTLLDIAYAHKLANKVKQNRDPGEAPYLCTGSEDRQYLAADIISNGTAIGFVAVPGSGFGEFQYALMPSICTAVKSYVLKLGYGPTAKVSHLERILHGMVSRLDRTEDLKQYANLAGLHFPSNYFTCVIRFDMAYMPTREEIDYMKTYIQHVFKDSTAVLYGRHLVFLVPYTPPPTAFKDAEEIQSKNNRKI
jgi:hypothetical protein